MTKRNWKMPEWMERFRDCIVNTGGNSVEDLMNSDSDPSVNLPLSMLEMGVQSQVSMLLQMRRKGMI